MRALEDAYSLHGGLVYTFCRRMVGESLAEDITQEVFLRAYRNREQFKPERGTLAGWLIAISKNRIIDHFRAEQRHTKRRDVHERIEAAAEPQIEGAGDSLLIAEALRRLPERARKVIALRYFDDLTHQQIADRLRMPVGTVKSDLSRGLAQIRRQLESAHE
ncbi:MAG: RNA polymerase sigma factor [Acidimicrobiia bacterium]|nr:RNA polymerase sigma factor [Acidimicrobiia bacterium]MYB11040.1 RNA polymerase sigma factor [Acidimicrobiia bacterium]MYB74256.1 RNA polymerase sigma factor [Acidimicrobiia bacterium]MYG57654.1 RNA polymerase sigma factor [Acidimicrobiia bacterium]MYH98847.1 RNA polymerase sigma factor [Acidimicrobiia bacterium]